MKNKNNDGKVLFIFIIFFIIMFLIAFYEVREQHQEEGHSKVTSSAQVLTKELSQSQWSSLLC